MPGILPVELVLYLGHFLPLHTKLVVCKALWDSYPDVRKWNERKRVRRAVRQCVKNDDVGTVEKLAAMTDRNNNRILKPQFIRLAITERSFRVLVILCARYDAFLNKFQHVTFSCPAVGIAYEAIPLPQPTADERYLWEKLVCHLLRWEILMSWHPHFRIKSMRFIVGEGPTVETLARMGFSQGQIAALSQWEEEERQRIEEERTSRQMMVF
jgi:hypothetical protein